MKRQRLRPHRLLIPVLVLLLFGTLAPPAAAEDTDYAIPNGHFYTQAAGPHAPAGYGYAITDEVVPIPHTTAVNAQLWSEYQRLGGVAVLGYPASHRFFLGPFVAQVTQRAVLEWNPGTQQVDLVNIMDLLHAFGKDDSLLQVRQVPRMVDYSVEEQGLSFQQIMTKRSALLDANPAIKAAFFNVPDPLRLYGLPTSPVTDLGTVYALRTQRAVFQQWKQDTPWAKAGTVTIALAGDLAKETGVIAGYDKKATQPGAPPPSPPRPTGRPAITPSQPGHLSEADVRAAFAQHPDFANGPRITATEPPTIQRIEFLTEAELRMRTHGESTRLPDSTLLCYVILHGSFIIGGGPPGAPSRIVATEIVVFDARSGNLLLAGA